MVFLDALILFSSLLFCLKWLKKLKQYQSGDHSPAIFSNVMGFETDYTCKNISTAYFLYIPLREASVLLMVFPEKIRLKLLNENKTIFGILR